MIMEDVELGDGGVMCPSVFGAYPVAGDGTAYARLGETSPVRATVQESRWEQGGFWIVVVLAAGQEVVTLRLGGGASTPRSLSQSLLSQCMEANLANRLSGLVEPEALADFLFDQLAPAPMRGLFRQQKGVCGSPWLSISDFQEQSITIRNPAALLGELVKHPAARFATCWRSMSPLGGAACRVPSALQEQLEKAEPHLRAGGCLVLGPTALKSGAATAVDLGLPAEGWIMTGRRGGVEALARKIALEQMRPMITVSRYDDAAPLLSPELFSRIIVDQRNRPIGPFRQKMVEQVRGAGSVPPRPLTA